MAGSNDVSKCFTCDALSSYMDLTAGFADNLSHALQGPILILFSSLVGLWLVIQGYRLLFHMTKIEELVSGLVYIVIATVLLGSQANGLISAVYSGSLEILSGASETAFSVAGGVRESGSGGGLVGLAQSAEIAVLHVIDLAVALIRQASTFEVDQYLYAILLVIPYFLLVLAYSSQVVVAFLRLMMAAIFAPFLFMAFAFGWGRGMAWAGARTILGSILVLFASTSALALTLHGVNLANEQVTASAANGNLDDFASFSNAEFLVIVFLGWMGTALMTEGVSIANSIVQTALTNTAAGVMTAGGAATAMAALKMGGSTGKTALNAASLMSGPVGIGARGINAAMNISSTLAEKAKNINKPGGQ